MSSAKWHPASLEFGIFGDVEEGSVESRAAEAQAGRGLQALEEYNYDINIHHN